MTDAFFGRLEVVPFLAALQDKAFEVAEAIEDHFANFAGMPDVFVRGRQGRVTRQAGIVERWFDEGGIDAQSLYLIAELADVAKYGEIAHRLLQERLARLDRNRHPESAQHLARGNADILPLRQPRRR